MNEEQARQILTAMQPEVIQPDDILYCLSPYVHTFERGEVLLDGHFTSEQLSAIQWWMENKLKET